MKLSIKCFHPSDDENEIGEAYEMQIVDFENAAILRCPNCKREIIMNIEDE